MLQQERTGPLGVLLRRLFVSRDSPGAVAGYPQQLPLLRKNGGQRRLSARIVVTLHFKRIDERLQLFQSLLRTIVGHNLFYILKYIHNFVLLVSQI